MYKMTEQQREFKYLLATINDPAQLVDHTHLQEFIHNIITPFTMSKLGYSIEKQYMRIVDELQANNYQFATDLCEIDKDKQATYFAETGEILCLTFIEFMLITAEYNAYARKYGKPMLTLGLFKYDSMSGIEAPIMSVRDNINYLVMDPPFYATNQSEQDKFNQTILDFKNNLKEYYRAENKRQMKVRGLRFIN